MVTEMPWFLGEFNAFPLNISETWHPAYFQSSSKIFIESQLVFGARDVAMDMSTVSFFLC
jgi:hypothetical protein